MVSCGIPNCAGTQSPGYEITDRCAVAYSTDNEARVECQQSLLLSVQRRQHRKSRASALYIEALGRMIPTLLPLPLYQTIIYNSHSANEDRILELIQATRRQLQHIDEERRTEEEPLSTITSLDLLSTWTCLPPLSRRSRSGSTDLAIKEYR